MRRPIKFLGQCPMYYGGLLNVSFLNSPFFKTQVSIRPLKSFLITRAHNYFSAYFFIHSEIFYMSLG